MGLIPRGSSSLLSRTIFPVLFVCFQRLSKHERLRMKKYMIYGLIFAAGVIAATVFIKHGLMEDRYAEMHAAHHGNSAHHKGNGEGAHRHDEVNMPGLQGRDTTEQEVNDLKEIFRSHQGITREVTNLANGIVTTTEAEDVDLREAIVTHVSMMVTRLEEGRNPEVIIQSPTLDALFGVYEDINTEIEMTDKGVKVTQTSSNPEAVALLQTHAAEVSDMAKRGMQAVHERMSEQHQ